MERPSFPARLTLGLDRRISQIRGEIARGMSEQDPGLVPLLEALLDSRRRYERVLARDVPSPSGLEEHK